ncbi:hypothetical protein ABPG74_013247 [Tetrahymena malaccensis]
MLKKTSRDYSQNKSSDSHSDDNSTAPALSLRGSDYLAFDIQKDIKKSILSDFSDESDHHHHMTDKVDFIWLLKSCIEEALSYFLEWAPLTIIYFFMTRTYSQHIANGYGLGLVWLNCMGQGLYYGLGSGLETMASHAHGAKNYEQVGILFQKTLFVSSIMFIPICIMMIYAEQILLLWNENADLCQIAGQLCIFAIPGIAFVAVYYAFKATLNAQNEYRLQVYSSGINTILTIIYCFIFITGLDCGIMGAAIVFSLSQFSNLVLCYMFANRKKHLKKCFIPFTKLCFQDLKPFLKTAIPIGSLVSLEWILQEVNSIIASNLPEEQYSANIAIANLASTSVQFPLGYATAACTFIGNEMGRGNVKNAKKYALYSTYIVISHLIITGLPIAIFRESIASTFTVNPEVKEQFMRIIFFALGVYFLDAIQCLVTAFMRAIAKEKFSSASFLICYALVGLTSSYYLAYKTSFEITGVWTGLGIGMSLYLILQVGMILFTNLENMAKKIQSRLKQNSDNNENLINNISIQVT